MMDKLIKSENIKRLLALLFAEIMFFAIFPSSPVAKATNSDGEQIMVSLGDSFSSGEGIPPFGQQTNYSAKVADSDWLAHRSEKAWPGMLTLPTVNGTMAGNRVRNGGDGGNWYFVASSGATTEHFNGEQIKKYKKGDYEGEKKLQPQLNIFGNMGGNKADYVTLTIGGNDADFSGVITSAVINTPLAVNIVFFKLSFVFADFYRSDGIRSDIHQAYLDVEAAAGKQAAIIVAGYPKLICEDGSLALFDDEEAKLINGAVVQFNRELEALVNHCSGNGMNIHFVSVQDKFAGHEAYTNEPFIHKVMFGTEPEDLKDSGLNSSYSVHPTGPSWTPNLNNPRSGAEAYASAVQEKINEIEEEKRKATMSDERDIVLVLDTSGSMSGKPIEETRKASANFISTVLQEDASIGVVTYEDSAEMISNFSMDEGYLKAITQKIGPGGSTNIEAGLSKAHSMLQNSSAEKKIIVLMSDGEPNVGKVGDELVSYADTIKEEGIYIYTIGFFENMGSKSSAQILLEDLASDGCHYEVASADELIFFFGDIADQLNGQKYTYVRIACPVDVTVSHGGETLCSIADEENTRTSFGSLTFEESDEPSETEGDDRVKILRLKEGVDYDVKIEGNGKGKMDYTIGFMDDAGEYSDMRKFNNIKITKKTVIDTVAAPSKTTVLNVDEDGDGKYDLKYKAKANGRGELVDYTYLVYIGLGVVAFVGVLIVYVKIKKRFRKTTVR